MDAVEYKNGQKNNWRRTMWNLVRANVANPADAVVLYLPGSKDLDRPEAIRRGFKAANLIAVERDAAVIKHLRAQGTTTIPGDILAVIFAWPVGVPVQVVVADLQCGMGVYVECLLSALSHHPAFNHTRVVLNLQRGRDASKTLDAAAGVVGECRRMPAGTFLPADERAMKTTSEKDRSVMAAALWLCDHMRADVHAVIDRKDELEAEALRLNERALAAIAAGDGATYRAVEGEYQREVVAELVSLLRFMQGSSFKLPSYKSSPKSPVFDSVLLANPGFAFTLAGRRSRWSANDLGVTCDGVSVASKKSESDAEAHARKIAAALAIRTRKLRGELRPA